MSKIIGDNELSEFINSIERVNCDKINMVNPVFMHSAIGIADEAGELTEILKRALYYGEDLDDDHVLEEYGDMLYYMVLDMKRIAKNKCKPVSEIIRMTIFKNIAKLEKRYPNGFREENAQTYNRNVKIEREAMDKVK